MSDRKQGKKGRSNAADSDKAMPAALGDNDRALLINLLRENFPPEQSADFVDSLEQVISQYIYLKNSKSGFKVESAARRVLAKWEAKLEKLDKQLDELVSDAGVQIRLNVASQFYYPPERRFNDGTGLAFVHKIAIVANETGGDDQRQQSGIEAFDRAKDAIQMLHHVVAVAKLLRAPSDRPEGGHPKDNLRLSFINNVADMYEKFLNTPVTLTEDFINVADIALRAAHWNADDSRECVREALQLRQGGEPVQN